MVILKMAIDIAISIEKIQNQKDVESSAPTLKSNARVREKAKTLRKQYFSSWWDVVAIEETLQDHDHCTLDQRRSGGSMWHFQRVGRIERRVLTFCPFSLSNCVSTVNFGGRPTLRLWWRQFCRTGRLSFVKENHLRFRFHRWQLDKDQHSGQCSCLACELLGISSGRRLWDSVSPCFTVPGV